MNFPHLNTYAFFGENRFLVDIEHEVEPNKEKIKLYISSNYEDLPSQIRNVTQLQTKISCRLTYKSISTNESSIELDLNDFLGNVEIDSQLIAIQNTSLKITNCIDSFYNDNYIITKGQILTSIKTQTFYVASQKISTDNIVDIRCNKDQIDEYVIKYNQDIIQIQLSNERVYKIFSKLQYENSELAFSLVPSIAIYAALTSIEDVEDVLGWRWFNTLKKLLNKENEYFEDLKSDDLLNLVQNELGFSGTLTKGLLKLYDNN